MPFKSEEQRRYLWANEPEIARDWTDTYGSKIHAANGGIMRLPFQWGGPGSGRDERGYQRSHPSHSSQRNTGPINVHADSKPVIQQQRKTDFLNEVRRQQAEQAPDVFEQSWSGQPGIFGIGGGYKNLKTPGVTGGDSPYKSRFGIGNLLSGAMSMFGGIPGSIMSMLSHLDPRQLRGKNPDGGWNTQAQYEQARAERQLRNRIERLRKTRDTGRYANDPEGWAASDLSGRLSDFENQLGITGIASDINYPGGEPTAIMPDISYDSNIDMQNYLENQSNFTPGGITEIDTETTEKLLPEENILEEAKRINAAIREGQRLRSLHPHDKHQSYRREKFDNQLNMDTDTVIEQGQGPRITQIGGEGLSIPKEWLEAPISQIERTIQNLQTGVDNANALGMEGSEDNEKNKEKLEQLKKVLRRKIQNQTI